MPLSPFLITLGYDFKLLKEVQRVNKEQRSAFIKKIEEVLWIIQDKKFALWGISFKPETDDMREAPALYIIEELKKRGAKIQAYDPQAMKEIKRLLSKKEIAVENAEDRMICNIMRDVTLCETPEEALEEAECLLLLTEWKNI